MNSKLQSLLNLWPQVVAGYHKSCDHYWQFVGEYNVLSEEINWWLKHDGYCFSNLYFGPFKTFEELQNWDGKTLDRDDNSLHSEMLKICHDELSMSEDAENDRDMPPEHWNQLIEKLENL